MFVFPPSECSLFLSHSYTNTFAAATQIVPTVGVDGKPVSTGVATHDNGGDVFPTAAIAVLAIVGGFAFIFAAYQVYKRCSRRFNSSNAEVTPYPETRTIKDPLDAGAGAFASLPSAKWGTGGFDSMGRRSASGLARSRQASWGGDSWGGGYGSSEKGDATPSSAFAVTPLAPGSPTSREGSPGPANGSRGSLNAFPSQGSMSGIPNSSTRNSLALPRRSAGTHNRAGSSYSAGGSPHLGGGSTLHSFPSGNRLSGAPHNPHSRIDIVPPLPLAPPPGQVIASGKSTLDFAPSSGIGGPQGGEGASRDEFLSIVHSAQYENSQDVEERLNPTFDGSYQHPSSSSYSQHSFPPSAASSSGSSRSSSAAPRQSLRNKPSGSNLRGNAPPSSSAGGVAQLRQPPPSASANSSNSTLSSSSSGGVPQPRAAPRRTRAPISVNTSAATLQGSGGDPGPKSPLEKLQMQMERQARGLTLQQEQTGGR